MGRFRMPRVGFCAVVLVALLGPLAFAGAAGAGSSARLERLTAELKGANEVPPADADGRGVARITIDDAKNEVCFKVRFDNIMTPHMGHIHAGVAGVNGPIVVTLFMVTPTDPFNDQLEVGRASGCATDATADEVTAILANPGNFYVNVHNARYPGGAIRGQLVD
jgi:CHRD domain